MKLFAFPLSPFSAKVRIVLAEKALACEIENVPTTRAGIVSKPAELVAINPRGQVPVLVDGELGIYDSTVILEYLEERAPERPLYPKDPVSRARCRQLEDAGDEVTSGPFVVLVREVWRKQDEAARDAAAIAAASADLSALAGRLDRTLAGKDWQCGDFSVADIACFVPFSLAAVLGFAAPHGLTLFHAWLARAAQRPSVAGDAALMRADVTRIASLPRV
jgi:glutathione S-transferase